MKRISGYTTNADYERLLTIKNKYGFKSVYQIIKYLIHSFLRVADPDRDKTEEPLPEEIKEMFEEVSNHTQDIRETKRGY